MLTDLDDRHALISAFQAVLVEASKCRDQREWLAPGPFGVECAWVGYERGVMLQQINRWRERRHLPPILEREVARVEREAAGHSDYGLKYAIGCTELSMEGSVLEFSAKDLPERSVVVDDLRGIAWYANANPGEEDRWDATGEKGCCRDSTVDWALQHGATVLRRGDDTEGELWSGSAPAEAPEGCAMDAAGHAAHCIGRHALNDQAGDGTWSTTCVRCGRKVEGYETRAAADAAFLGEEPVEP